MSEPLTAISEPRKRKLFESLGERDGFLCQHCGGTADLTIDHVDPAGPTILSNLQLLCRSCNSAKGDRPEKVVRWDSAVWQAGFTMIPNKVLLEAPMTAPAFRVYVLLQHFAHRPDSDWPGQDGLAALAQCSERTLRGALRELETAKLLRTRRRGLGKTNVYVLLAPRAGSAGSRAADSAGQEPPDFAVPVQEDLKKEPRVKKTPGEAGSDPAAPPPLVRVDGRNVALDALAEVCGLADGDPDYRSAVAALNGRKRGATPEAGINELAWGEAIEAYTVTRNTPERLAELRANPEQWGSLLALLIRRKAGLYRNRMGDAVLTPTALRRWWLRLERMDDIRGDRRGTYAGDLDLAALLG